MHKSRVAFRGIKEACIESKERLYLTNSNDLIKLYYEFGMIDLFPQLSQNYSLGDINFKHNQYTQS
jgi:hypothetical protein